MTITTKMVEEDTQRAAAEVQLQKYGKFIEEYMEKLNKMQQRLLLLTQSSAHHYSPNASTLTICINYQPTEQVNATDVINCDNKIVDKIVRVFSCLCREVSFIRNELEGKYLNLILYYGEDVDENASYEDCQLAVSKILADLQHLSAFVKHCERVLLEIMSQLSSFYQLNLHITRAGLYEVFDALGETLIALVIIQEALSNNTALIYHWSLYKRTIQLASHSASDFPYSRCKIQQLDQLITKLESRLIACKIFDNVLSLPFNEKTDVKNNKKLCEKLTSYLREVVIDLERTVQHESVESASQWAKACVIYILCVNVFGTYDKKFLKSLSAGVKKFALITLHSNIVFRIDEFLLKYVGHLLKPAEKKLFQNNNQQCVGGLIVEVTSKLNSDIPFYAVQVLSWVLRMEQKIKRDISSNLNIEHLRDISGLLFEGLRYASCIKTTLSTISNLYISLEKPMSKTTIVSFCKLVEILMSIEYIFHHHHTRLSNLSDYIAQYAKYECIAMLNNVESQLTGGTVGADNKYVKESDVDTASCLVIAEDVLNGGPATKLRISIAKLCLNLVGQQVRGMTELDRRLSTVAEKLSATSSLQEKLASLLECASFMYWNKNLLPVYFDEINVKRHNVNRVEYLLHAILLRMRHDHDDYHCNDYDNNDNGDDIATLSTFVSLMYEKQVYIDCLTKVTRQIIHPLCGRIEENLRLNVLQHLQQPTTSDDQNVSITRNFQLNNFYKTRNIYLDGKYVNICKIVEDYLNKMFYNLTTVALYNYQIHGEMKMLALSKFGLRTIEDDNLPNHSLEQGVDLLEITRNIDTFVAGYFYNLNNQLFVQMRSNNKYLNTVNIKHISNSIRSHGTGIMSTAVNYTYQLLRQKLNTFSQFLFDEQIKSRLLKDIAAYKEQLAISSDNNESTPPRYPFERAERFNRGIVQKLGMAKDGSTYLDQFRNLITQIGNALGYVRMIKSGGLHCCSNSAVFIPDLKHIVNFEHLCRADQQSEICCRAATYLDDAIGNVADKITEDVGTNYFKLMVDVFAPVLRDPKNSHLRNFHILIPSLTINYVEYFIAAKESMIKQNKTTACFTDDGFAVGIAYLLRVLNLQVEFDSLHWFQSVTERNRRAIQKLNSNISTASKDDQTLEHTLSLSLKRIKSYHKEFNLLSYNLHSARVLFENRNEVEQD